MNCSIISEMRKAIGLFSLDLLSLRDFMTFSVKKVLLYSAPTTTSFLSEFWQMCPGCFQRGDVEEENH